jgi:hypothetical protein
VEGDEISIHGFAVAPTTSSSESAGRLVSRSPFASTQNATSRSPPDVVRRARQGLTLAWSPAQYARVMKSGSPPQVREPATTASRSFTRPMIALVVLVLGGVGVVVYRAEASIQNGSASLDAVAWTSAVDRGRGQLARPVIVP